MRSHPGGEAVTYMVTLAGEPSIPGAKSYPEVFPYTFTVESPGPENVPFTNWDNPTQFRTDFTTGFPDGNIADADQRWALIQQDTLPAYQDLLATDPARAEQIIASDFDDRVEQYRPTNNIPGIMDRFLAASTPRSTSDANAGGSRPPGARPPSSSSALSWQAWPWRDARSAAHPAEPTSATSSCREHREHHRIFDA